MEIRKEREHLNMQMEMSIQENLKIISFMDKVNLNLLMEICIIISIIFSYKGEFKNG